MLGMKESKLDLYWVRLTCVRKSEGCERKGPGRASAKRVARRR